MEVIGAFHSYEDRKQNIRTKIVTTEGKTYFGRSRHVPLLSIPARITGQLNDEQDIRISYIQYLTPFVKLARTWPELKPIPTAIWNRMQIKWENDQEIVRILVEEPDRINEITENQYHKKLLLNAVHNRLEFPRLKEYLSYHGITDLRIYRIYKDMKNVATERLVKNPYLFAKSGLISWSLMEKMARESEVPSNDIRRLRGAIEFFSSRSMRSGDTFIFTKRLAIEVKRATTDTFPLHLLQHEMNTYFTEKEKEWGTNKHKSIFYNKARYWTEILLSEKVANLVQKHKAPADLDDVLDNLIENKRIRPLTSEQRKGVHQFWEEQFSLINGKPGSGKSEVISAIEQTIQHYKPGLEYANVCPTGIAAQKLGDNASTIHSFIKKAGDNRAFHNELHPVSARAIITDEAGMMDVFLTKDLIQAAPDDTKFVLIGDVNQLPPVGPGEPFRAFVEVGIPCVTLTQNLRAGEGSLIDQMTAAILNQDAEKAESLLTGNDVFHFHEEKNLSSVVARITALYKEKERLILSPYKDSFQLGSVMLNHYLQAATNPSPVRLGFFRAGDRVIQVENNKERGLSNGHRGVISRINMKSFEIIVNFDSMGKQTYSLHEAMQELELAMALTVHKTQGMEYPEVILPIYNDSNSQQHMWNITQLYTAVSRAREKVHFVGSKNEFLASLLKKGRERNSDLAIRLKKRLT